MSIKLTHFNSILLAICLFHLFTASTYASTVYNYTGNLFTSFDDDVGGVAGTIPGAFDTTMSVNGYFETANPLGLNLADVDYSSLVLDYSFSDGRNTLDSSNSFFQAFILTTDNFGISSWEIQIHQNGYFDLVNGETITRILTRTYSYEVDQTNIFDQGFVFTCLVTTCNGVDVAKGTFDAGKVKDVGVWSSSATVVPIPAAAWLFGSGLIGLIGVARRRK